MHGLAYLTSGNMVLQHTYGHAGVCASAHPEPRGMGTTAYPSQEVLQVPSS